MLRWSPVRLSNMPYDVAPVTMRENNGDCVVACVTAYFEYRKENFANQGGNVVVSMTRGSDGCRASMVEPSVARARV